jgi:hypothetical protein
MRVPALIGLDVGCRNLADGDDMVLPVVIARTGVVGMSGYGNSSTEPTVLRLSMSRCAIAAAGSA